MNEEVLATPEAVARRAAELIAQFARAAVEARGRFSLAVSGGKSPAATFDWLARQQLPWSQVDLFQVDERIAPASHPDRNLTLLQSHLLAQVALPSERVHAMPVEQPDLTFAMAQYAAILRDIAGTPPVLDLIHLGLGNDGHTASLVPGDPVLEIANAEVAVTQPYQGYRRMTLTYPVLNRARTILWVVTGSEKAPALDRLRRGDPSIPAGRVAAERAVLLADTEAAQAIR
jgi:6-phosphogluconolactonase